MYIFRPIIYKGNIRLGDCTPLEDLTVIGSEFQTLGAWWLKRRSPLASRANGSSSRSEFDDLRLRDGVYNKSITNKQLFLS